MRRQIRRRAGVIEVHRLLAEGDLVVDPVQHVADVEGLRPDMARWHARGFVIVDHLLRIGLLREAIEGHRHARALQLGRHLHAQALEQLDALLVRHQRAAARARVQIGAPVGGAAEVLGRCARAWIGSVHLAAQGLELGQRDVAGAALGAGCREADAGGIEGRRREQLGALGGQRSD